MKQRRLFWVSLGEFIKNVQVCAATLSVFTTQEKLNIESKIAEIKTLVQTSDLKDEVLIYVIKLHQLDLCYMAGKIDPTELQTMVDKCAEILEGAVSKMRPTRSPPDGAE